MAKYIISASLIFLFTIIACIIHIDSIAKPIYLGKIVKVYGMEDST